MRWTLERKIIAVGFGLGLLILGAIALISYRTTTKLYERQKRVEYTYEILQKIRDVLTTLRDAERARRGYIITGKELYLVTYNTSIQSVNAKFDAVRRSTADNPKHQRRLDTLEPLIAQRVALIRQSVQLYKQNPLDTNTQIALTDRGLILHDEIWKFIAQMESEEQSSLQNRAAESQASFRDMLFMQSTGFGLSFVLLLGVYFLLYQQMQKRQQIEDFQRTLEKERELSELKLRFFAMVSHEFRTPLSTILISAQLLENYTPEWPKEKALKNIYRIQSAAKTIRQLLTDILNLNRAESGELELKPEPINLEIFCHALIEEVELIYGVQNRLFFIGNFPKKEVCLDEKTLRSILINLLSNSIKYSPEDSPIYFVVNWELKSVVFQIKDQGIGIDPEDRLYLFQTFHRGKNVGNVSGIGLGLAVVKKCVDLHGGNISVDSQVGVGTTFTVTLPLKSWSSD